MTARRRTPYPLNVILPPVTVAEQSAIPTVPAPPPKPTDSEKLDQLLGLVQMLGNHAMETNKKLDGVEFTLGELNRLVSGMRSAEGSLFDRADKSDRRAEEHDRELGELRERVTVLEPDDEHGSNGAGE
jgi:hypothetical protein